MSDKERGYVLDEEISFNLSVIHSLLSTMINMFCQNI